MLLDHARTASALRCRRSRKILGNSSLDYYHYDECDTTGLMQWALPVHVQVPVGSVRLHSSAGYFSVGSSFAGASLEAPVSRRLVLVGTISQSFAKDSDTLALDANARAAAAAFALAGLGSATVPWLVGVWSTNAGSLRAGLMIPLIGCLTMIALHAYRSRMTA